jgi:outer membrane receptor protein involved in Fe transport
VRLVACVLGVATLSGGIVPAALADELPRYQSVVTPTRGPTPLAEVPATVTVIDREQLDSTPDKLIDEALRDMPSFGAFRRTSSAVADPTSQGLNLRGVGPSGVSRGLVLVDGVPETDAFGGWVYWRSLPTLAIDRIEIVPGRLGSLRRLRPGRHRSGDHACADGERR